MWVSTALIYLNLTKKRVKMDFILKSSRITTKAMYWLWVDDKTENIIFEYMLLFITHHFYSHKISNIWSWAMRDIIQRSFWGVHWQLKGFEKIIHVDAILQRWNSAHVWGSWWTFNTTSITLTISIEFEYLSSKYRFKSILSRFKNSRDYQELVCHYRNG